MGNRSSKIYCAEYSTDNDDSEILLSVPVKHSAIKDAVEVFLSNQIRVLVDEKASPLKQSLNSDESKHDVLSPISPLGGSLKSYNTADFGGSVTTSGNSLHSKKSNGRNKSLSSFAMRQHLKQDNKYVPTEAVTASVIMKIQSAKASHNSSWNTLGQANSGSDGNILGVIDEAEVEIGSPTIAVGLKKAAVIPSKLEIQDDVDWIPVSDDEQEDTHKGNMS